MSDCQQGPGGLSGLMQQLGQGQELKTAKVELTLEELPNAIRYRADDLRTLRGELDAIAARIRGFGTEIPKNLEEPDVAPVMGDTLLIKAGMELCQVTEETQMVRERVQLIYKLLFPG